MGMRIEYKDALIDEVKRILEKMKMNDPSTAVYKEMARRFIELDDVVRGIEYNELDKERIYFTSENKCSQEKVVAAVEEFPTEGTVSKSVGGSDLPVVEESVPWVEEPKAEEKLTKEKVRALLKEAAEAGVMVQPIMAKFIPEGKKQTFSSVKATDYEALVKELNNARNAQ